MAYTRLKCSCVLCKSEVSISNLSNHYNSKQCQDGGKQVTIASKTCKHCLVAFPDSSNSVFANHVRWCINNPKRDTYTGRSRTEQLRTPEALVARRAGISEAHRTGKYVNSHAKRMATRRKNGTLTHTAETRSKLCEIARMSKHQRVCKSTHAFTDKRGRTFKFDSSWEDALAHRLDDLDIRWERPEPIQYELDGKVRNYFSDFYLPDYDLYLDPKNSYCCEQQKEKLQQVHKLINLEVITTKDDCKTWSPRQDSNLGTPT